MSLWFSCSCSNICEFFLPPKQKQNETNKNWLFKPERHGWKAYVCRGSANRSLCLGLWVAMALPNGTAGCDKTHLQALGFCKDQWICVRTARLETIYRSYALNYDILNFVIACWLSIHSKHPTSKTMSSMFPYRARFMPLALVAIQPPKVDSSIESGSIPIVTPCCFKDLLRGKIRKRAKLASRTGTPLTHLATRCHKHLLSC